MPEIDLSTIGNGQKTKRPHPPTEEESDATNMDNNRSTKKKINTTSKNSTGGPVTSARDKNNIQKSPSGNLNQESKFSSKQHSKRLISRSANQIWGIHASFLYSSFPS